MSRTTEPANPHAVEDPDAPDWRMRFSLYLTATWLFLGFVYITRVIGWSQFVSQDAPDLGSFLEGAFAPLAFLWLVIGFFLQQRQLEANTHTIELQLAAMQRTAEQAEVQARAIAADELHSRQDTFTRVAAMVFEQLGVTAGFLITSKLIETQDGSTEIIDDLWRRHGDGDYSAFNRHIFFMYASDDDVTADDLFWGTEIRAGHSRSFIAAFERLLDHAERCDPDGIIADAIREGSHGRTYRQMLESRPAGTR